MSKRKGNGYKKEDKNSTLYIYLDEVGRKYPGPLSREEELRFYLDYKKRGDVKARDRLVAANLPLVVKIAKDNFQGLGVPLEDLIGIGNLVFLETLDKDTFDPKRGVKFMSYCSKAIQKGMLSAILENYGRRINWPVLKKLKAISLVIAEHGMDYDDLSSGDMDIISAETKLPSKKIADLLAAVQRPLSLDEVHDSRDLNLGQVCPISERVESSYGTPGQIFEQVFSRELESIVRDLFRRNNVLEEVVFRRFGFNGHLPETLEEVAKELGYTKQNIELLQKKALVALNARLKEGGLNLNDYLG